MAERQASSVTSVEPKRRNRRKGDQERVSPGLEAEAEQEMEMEGENEPTHQKRGVKQEQSEGRAEGTHIEVSKRKRQSGRQKTGEETDLLGVWGEFGVPLLG